MRREVEVHVPDIGDFEAVDVVEILVAPGDRVAIEDPLVSLESDKATMEVPSPVAGEVLAVKVALGDAVSEGSLLVVVAASDVPVVEPNAAAQAGVTGSTAAAGTTAATRTAGTATAARVEAPAAGALPAAAGSTSPPLARFAHPQPQTPPPTAEALGVDRPVRAHAGPGIRRFARELGVDLAEVDGSGRQGRVVEADLKSHVKSAFERGPARAVAQAGLERSADVTDLEGWRRRIPASENAEPPSTLAVVLKAALGALRAFPDLLVRVPGSDGVVPPLVVAVEGASGDPGEAPIVAIVGADRLGVREIADSVATATATNDSSAASAHFRLLRDEIRGGRLPTPVRMPRERFALSVGPIEVVPSWTGSPDDALDAASTAGFEPRLSMPIAIDVAPDIEPETAERFLDHWAEILSAPARLLL